MWAQYSSTWPEAGPIVRPQTLTTMIWASHVFAPALLPALSNLALVSATNVTAYRAVNRPAHVGIVCQENPQAASIPVSDYFHVLQEILTLPNAMSPVSWHFPDPSRSETWSNGRASVVLQGTEVGSSDTFQPVLIARTAALVGQKCMTAQNHYRGGLTLIGDQAKLFLVVAPRADTGADDGQRDEFS